MQSFSPRLLPFLVGLGSVLPNDAISLQKAFLRLGFAASFPNEPIHRGLDILVLKIGLGFRHLKIMLAPW